MPRFTAKNYPTLIPSSLYRKTRAQVLQVVERGWPVEFYSFSSSFFFLSENVFCLCYRRGQAYVHWCEGLLSEFLVCIFERLNWVSWQTMMSSGLYNEVRSRVAGCMHPPPMTLLCHVSTCWCWWCWCLLVLVFVGVAVVGSVASLSPPTPPPPPP